MGYTFALVGNPNCGKTTMFNEMTGSTQYVGNWPGVTVEKKEGKARKIKEDIKIIDLPGIYSLSPYTLEEVVARNFIMNEKPDLIINIVDASNIERNLYLTMQLKELGVPVVVALNMMDVVNKRGDKINITELEKELGVKILPTSAHKGEGIKQLLDTCVTVSSVACTAAESNNFFDTIYTGEFKAGVNHISELVKNVAKLNKCDSKWLALKLLEQDEKVVEKIKLGANDEKELRNYIDKLEEKYDNDVEGIVADQRYNYIAKIIRKTVTKVNRDKLTGSDKIDKIVTNRFLALPIFGVMMYIVYYVSIQTLGDKTIGWMETFIETCIANPLTSLLGVIGAADWLQSLVIDGIVGGVGAVLGFVPQIMILFFFISILEDSGYMARVAFVMDKMFRRFGLSGKSFIPMLVGSGCSVPGIMATRTLENERDRKLTIILTPFISCGAKLPIYVLFVSAFFPAHSGLVIFSIYILGIVLAILSGILLKNTIFKGEVAPFVMELPQYRIPTIKGLFIHMWDRGKGFIKKAGTIILAGTVVIWFLQSFNTNFQMTEDINESILKAVGSFISPIFKPVGFGDWISSVAVITGLLAKEVVVSTFGIVRGIADAEADTPELISNIQSTFNAAQACSFMAFNLIAAPCFAAIAAMKRELNSTKLTLFALAYQTALAWIVAFIVYRIALLFM